MASWFEQSEPDFRVVEREHELPADELYPVYEDEPDVEEVAP
jgi:hypothetical protein